MDRAMAEIFTEELKKHGNIAGYQLGDRLGFGKSAVVFAAECDGGEYAVKIFHSGLLEHYGKAAQLERIEREKRLIGWNHQHLANIIDGGESPDGKHLYVVMERVPGIPLSAALSKVPRLAIQSLVRQLASAAKALEDYGFFHRDIKPGNIHYIEGDSPKLVLLDLGVLKPIGDSAATNLQKAGAFIGTHQYCPPEMIHGRQSDTVESWRAITFYQIGAVMHDLICGKPIFSHANDRIADLVQAIDTEEVVIRSEDIDAHLCDLATRCLLKNPDDRLRFVEWSNFFPVEDTDREVDQRIAQLRVRTERLAQNRPRNPLHTSELSRTATVHSDELCRTYREELDSAIGRINGIFPPRTTVVTPNFHPKPCITCTFQADSARGIVTPFKLQFALSEVEGSVAIEAYARASRGLEDTEIGWTHLGGFPRFAGLMDRLVDWMLEIAEELVEE
ncbi:protein kinase [Leptospira sp. 96542]|nr:protein kinase [Leptospira sp. 96542]